MPNDIPNSTWNEVDASNTAPVPNGAPEGWFPSDVNNVYRMGMGATKRFWDHINPTVTTGGSGSAYTLTYTVAPQQIWPGEVYSFELHANCAAGATVNINALGAKALRKWNGSAFVAVETDDLAAGMVVVVRANTAGSGSYDIISGYTQQPAASWVTGDWKWSARPTPEAGWIFYTGSIGSAASGASTRANADTQPLYTLFWNNYDDSLCPVAGGRGANAAADFAANKALTMIDMRGTTAAGPDNMGGTARNILGNGQTGGFTGTATLGKSAGEQSHQLTVAELAEHDHDYVGTATSPGSPGGGIPAPNAPGTKTSKTGGNAKHNNVQPTALQNCFIKL